VNVEVCRGRSCSSNELRLCLQNVPPSLLIRFLREHRSEWADYDMDASVATSFRSNGNGYGPRGGVSHVQLPLPLAHSGEHGEVRRVETCVLGDVVE
jgi:homeobox-leucine zipper protein